MSDFALAIPVILHREGGYVNNPHDEGEETNFGISKRSYPNVDIRNLTKEGAAAIYQRDFWNAYGYGRLAVQGIGTKIFDMAVNLGPRTAHKLAQEAAGAAPDGELGNDSIQRLNAQPALPLLRQLRSLLVDHYHEIVSLNPKDYEFLKGWLSRANDEDGLITV